MEILEGLWSILLSRVAGYLDSYFIHASAASRLRKSRAPTLGMNLHYENSKFTKKKLYLPVLFPLHYTQKEISNCKDIAFVPGFKSLEQITNLEHG